MKKLSIKKIAIGLFVIFIIASGFNRVLSGDSEQVKEQSLNTVNIVDTSEYASFEGEINAVGSVEAVNFVTVVSETSSPVIARLVNPGDFVVAGQPLVLFDGASSSIQLASAEASLRALEAQLTVQTSEPREEDVLQLQSAVDQALAQREQLIRSNNEAVQNAEKNIADLYQDTLKDVESIENSLRLSLVLISEMQDKYFNCTAKYCLDISDAKEDAILEAYDVRNAGRNIARSIQSIDSGVYEDIQTLKGSIDHNLMDDVRETLEDALVLTRVALVETRKAFDISLISSSTVSTDKASVEARISAVDGLLSNLRAIDARFESVRGDVYTDGQFEVLNTVKANAEQSRRSADASVASAEARLEALVEGPRDIDVAGLRAQIDGARAQYAQALRQANNQTIIAPFDGVIGTINAPVGQIVPVGQVVLTMFNDDAKRVKINLSVDDAKDVSFHENVVVSNDVQGVIEYVAPQVGNNGGVEVGIIAIDDESKLTVGERVEVSIKLKNDQNLNSTFNVPLQAVKTNSEGTFVYGVDENSIIVRYPVTTGQIRGSRIELFFDVEIPSAIIDSVRGLELGDKVIVK